MVTLEDIWKKWQKNADTYKTVEVGSGIHSLVKDVFLSEDLLNLRETPKKTGKFGTFTHDTAADEHGRPDFVIYAADDVTIPVEVKCFGRIKEGIPQLFRYQLDYSKQYGILTDGWEWRFYRAGQHSKFFLQEIFENKDDFLTFWNDYIKPEHYYSGIFNPKGQLQLFDEKIDLNDSENRKIFFDDTTNLIHKFMVKMRARGTFADYDDKKALETSYSYLIQFILFKVIVDNGFKDFTAWYKNLFRIIGNYIYNSDNYSAILNNIKVIADYVSMHIYKPFAKEQEKLNNLIFKNLSTNLIIEDISPWLDNLIFIDKYNFGNLRNEIFGFIYENYLKDLYHNENKGQYFTDPEVVNVMLEEVGYTAQNLKNQHDKLSIIDPSCGAGTFLYSAVDAIIGSFGGNFTKEEAQKIENIVSKNVFGLDIEEFPLYLAEMSILMKLLPLIINDDFENPIDEKIKVFKTKDSISEFLDAGIGAVNPDVDFPTLFDKNSLGYDSFVRDNQNLQEMIESMQGHNGERMRFDFVVGNPPYVDYNSCSRLKIPFVEKIRDKAYNSILMGDVYNVNLFAIPDMPKKYSPKPNLYAFFIALSLALIKNNGKMCYIVPQTMLTAIDLIALRYHLAKFVTIEKMLTFEGNLFIDRGLKENKPIATSSLIFVLTKKAPEPNHKVEIVNYKPYLKKQGESFKVYFKGKHRQKARHILQTELQENVVNWNFIKYNVQVQQFFKAYKKNTFSMEEYRRNVLSDYNEITFDGNINIDNKKILDAKPSETDCFLIPRLNKKYLTIQKFAFFDKSNPIKKAQGSQDVNLTLKKKYKVIWRYQNSNGFYYTDKDNVLPNFSIYSVASKNKDVILFLFALLKSPINAFVLDKYLKLANEKSFLVGLSSIKNFIRIPKITSENQSIKDKIIALTEKMLDLEKVVLSDLVDFKDFTIQRFENVEVAGKNLVLTFNGKDYKLPIKENSELVKRVISEKYYDNGLVFNAESVTLQELKTLETIDFEQQQRLKCEIDDLVYQLYFGNETEFKELLNN